ncbi:MAG: mechanosensitive ion channel [Ruminococcaceae bacterium]|nr:mechanosensitive ion channel [Oscillospiraceae bacterium]
MPEKIEQILNSFVDGCVDLAWRLIGALVVFLIGNLIIRFIIKRIRDGKLANKLDPMVHSFIASVTKIGLYMILTVIVVAILGVETASIIAVIASAGAAIALGLQGSLSHLAGGVMLLIFRPFKIGDFVDVCNYSGTISEVGIFYTEITTTDNRVCVIPNGTLIGSSIVNYSVKDTRRVDMVFDVAYGTDVEIAKQVILDEVAKVSAVLDTPAPFIRMTEMAGSALKITLRVWCNSADYWAVKFDLNEAINRTFAEKNIQIPYQQIDVHVKND